MAFVAQVENKLDQLGKPAWIVLVILGFWMFWPLGLAILAYTLWSGRMGCWKGHSANRWNSGSGPDQRGTWWQPPRSSGNRAFDEYRTETLRRLEDEQREFHEFLDRLRMAKDKSEFDQFMAERRIRPPAEEPPQRN
jgi:Protein of unknown function (DUF2852)